MARGAHVHAKTTDGFTPLHHAAVSGRTDVIKLLLAKGAVVNAKNTKGFAPLYYAVANGHNETTVLLRKHGGREH